MLTVSSSLEVFRSLAISVCRSCTWPCTCRGQVSQVFALGMYGLGSGMPVQKDIMQSHNM
jgi:hypothetical protein